MNEEGKATKELVVCCMSLMLLACFLLPFFDSIGFEFPLPAELFQTLEYSERVFWFIHCGLLISLIYVFSVIVGNISVYAVYFVQRFWYLHKLRKPERVYTGDPL